MISLVDRHRQRTIGCDALGQGDRTGQCLAGLGEDIDEAPLRGFLGGEAVAGQREFERLLVRNAVRQPEQSPAGRHQPAFDLGDAELGVLRRDHQIGGQHDLGAAGQRVAFDGGDHGLARRAFGESDAATRDGRNLTGHERLEVHARTEVAARARDDRHRELWAVVEFVHRVGETLRDRRG